MHWETLSCPNRHCACDGLPFGQGVLVQDGSSQGHTQALCQAWGQRMALTDATADCGLDTAPQLCALAVRVLAEGHALHATARMVQRDKETVCAWWHRAARQCRLVMGWPGKNRHGTACPGDALWRGVHTTEPPLRTAPLLCESEGAAWGWVAWAPAWRLGVALVVGTRTPEHAHRLRKRVVAVTETPRPCFTSDQLPASEEALLAASGPGAQPGRQGTRGRPPMPRWIPLPNLVEAQVVKRRDKGRVVEVTHTISLGEAPQIEARRAASAPSTTLHPSVVERDPLTWHDHHRRLRRTTLAFSQALPWWEQHVWVSWAYEHVCWPHQRLRQRLPAPEPTRGSGTPRRWQPVTPAMAAGITARVWTTAELLGYRIPATCLDTLDEREPLFPDPDAVYHVH